MSDNIPFEIQVEIMKSLPVKSLLRFRSVSKQWKSLIGSSGFIASAHHGNLQDLLIRYRPIGKDKYEYVSVVDDVTFPKQKASLTIPQSTKMVKNSRIIGCCNGMVCFYVDYGTCPRAVLWNPSVRKTVSFNVPDVPDVGFRFQTVLGFGVCRETNDPKIVKIKYVPFKKLIKFIEWQVEVFRLSTGIWRCVHANLTRKSVRCTPYKEAIDGFIYWLATDGYEITDGTGSTDDDDDEHVYDHQNLILSFDTTSEEFGEVHLPDSLAHIHSYYLSMFKLRKSLVVLEDKVDDEVCCVWMMGDSAAKECTKQYAIPMANCIHDVSCFRNTGEPMLQVLKDLNHSLCYRELVVYEPCSEHISYLGISGKCASFSVCSYMETLYLLDQPDFIDSPRENNTFQSKEVRGK